jgi:V/A-type H+-transporting ATPase subunit B
MILEHIGLSQINGSLVVLDGVKGVQYDEMAELDPRGPCCPCRW